MLAHLSTLESLQSTHGHSAPVTSSLSVFNALSKSELEPLWQEALTLDDQLEAFRKKIQGLFPKVDDEFDDQGKTLNKIKEAMFTAEMGMGRAALLINIDLLAPLRSHEDATIIVG